VGSRYLTDLADVMRRAGLTVVEQSGWQKRARGSGGYDSGRPWGVMWHHTASPSSWDGRKDADYITTGDSDAPLANLYIDRSGAVWVCAAGATNTNGKGGPFTGWSKGTVPADSMNTYAIGIELGNAGTGEPWPECQTDAAFAASIACSSAYGLKVDDVCSHNVWAPTRKIDPATASAVMGPWSPRSSTSSGTWHLEDIKSECRRRSSSTPAPPTPLPEEDIIVSGSSSLWLGGGRLDNFVTDDAGTVWHNWYEPGKGWTIFESLAGVLEGGVSATGQGSNGTPVRIDLTGKGVDSPPGLWHKWYDGSKWSRWERVADWPE
jgi:hypothetical protein